MFELILPYLIATALEMPLSGSAAAPLAEAPAAAEATATATAAAADVERVPEDQTPTGKFTTATEIRPIMDATRGSWIAVREYEGQDWLYFTQMLAWRCGLWEIRYGVNGGPADSSVPIEPCHDDMAQPNVMIEMEAYPPYVTFPLQSVESVSIEVLYDDGSTDSATFQRNEVRIP